MVEELRYWLTISLEGKSLESFFKRNKIKTVAIYGGGTLGNFLYHEVKKYGINVKLCIDRSIHQFHNISVIRPDQLIYDDEIDLIVICIRAYPIIKKPGYFRLY